MSDNDGKAIAFSRDYWKLKIHGSPKHAWVKKMLIKKFEELPQKVREYDGLLCTGETISHSYGKSIVLGMKCVNRTIVPLPPKWWYMWSEYRTVLRLMLGTEADFTVIKRWTPSREKIYKSIVGKEIYLINKTEE